MAHHPHHQRTYQRTLLTASVAERLLAVLFILVLLWLLVGWALEGTA